MARIDSAQPEPRVLLVEGPDDKHVILQICNRSPQTPDFYIEDRGGVEPLLDAIGAELIVPERRALGILTDADDDLPARWAAITNRLAEEGVQVPNSPEPNGMIIDTVGKPRVGIWLMPDNSTNGELENFVAQMIPTDDNVWPLSQQYVNQIPLAERKFAPNKTLRSQIHAWLAVREDPRQMGLAIRARDLAADGSLCRGFLDWLTRLFV